MCATYWVRARQATASVRHRTEEMHIREYLG